MREKYNVSFSGGRTSAYMGKWLLDNFPDRDYIFTFANTGLEDNRTLDFVHACDKHFGFNTVWLEAVVHHGERVGTSHKIVTYETASRNAEPFEEVIKKYGIPNVKYLHCTRELKLAPMQTYLKSIGVNYKKIPTALGIRIDEDRRVRKDACDFMIEYPLVDLHPTDKADVLHWWSRQDFDLELEDEFLGNCYACFKKSDKKQYQQIEKDPSRFEWYRKMDRLHKRTNTKQEDPDRVFFRGNLDTDGLFAKYEYFKSLAEEMQKINDNQLNLFDYFPETDVNIDSGCGQSCEMFPME